MMSARHPRHNSLKNEWNMRCSGQACFNTNIIAFAGTQSSPALWVDVACLIFAFSGADACSFTRNLMKTPLARLSSDTLRLMLIMERAAWNVDGWTSECALPTGEHWKRLAVRAQALLKYTSTSIILTGGRWHCVVFGHHAYKSSLS